MHQARLPVPAQVLAYPMYMLNKDAETRSKMFKDAESERDAFLTYETGMLK